MLKEIGRDICNGILLSHYNSFMKKEIIEINNENLNDKYKNNIENKLNKINSEFEEYINGLKCKINNNKNSSIILDNTKSNEDIEANGNDNDNYNESDSESEPSRDNLDEEEIKVLLPFFKKSKNLKKKTKSISMIKHFRLFKIKKNVINNSLKNNNIQVHTNKVSSFPKIEKNQTLIPKNSKKLIIKNLLSNNNNLGKPNINLTNRFLFKNRNKKNSSISLSNIISSINNNKNSIIIIKTMEDKMTQTEEKFFRFHWSHFIGIYKIMTVKHEEKKANESISFLCLDKQIDRNSILGTMNRKCPSTLTSFNLLPEEKKYYDNKNESQKMFLNSRNKNNLLLIKKADNMEYFYSTKYTKREQNFSYSCEQIKENKINSKIKMNYKGKSIQKVIKSFISNIASISKNDYLRQYLNNEDRINEYLYFN